MASCRKLFTKDGTSFYEISVSRGRGKSRLSTRWYPPHGWSQRAIDKEIKKQEAAFEKAVETAYKAVMKPKEGTILTVAKGISDKANELMEAGCDDLRTSALLFGGSSRL